MYTSLAPRRLGLINWMWWRSSRKRSAMSVEFHSLVSLERRSDTMRSWSFSCIGPWGFSAGVDMIQESCHTHIDSSLQIDFPRWLRRRSRPHRIPFHQWEEVPWFTVRKEALWQYLPMRMRAKRQSGYVISLQAIFAKRAWLKRMISRKPKPHKAFGLVRCSHETQ